MSTKPLLFLALASFLACSPSEGQTSGGHVPGTAAGESFGLAAQDDPWSEGIVGTGLLLRRLDGVKRVLMIGAHPDDEDTSLLAALARGMGVETAYLSLTRGEGGQNLIGSELGEGLGLVRTGELLAARSLDGGRQYFTRAFDFGYSKTAEESFRFWPREEILEDVTWVVRTFRPQVIVSVFSGTPRDGHGHHHVAGLMAQEVFQVAGDSTRFPDQISVGANPWTPSKLYRLTRRNPQEGTAGIETGVFDPLLGRSHFQIAMDSRSQHRSQDMGGAQPMGPRRSTVALLDSRVKSNGPDEIFSGVDTSLVALAGGLPLEIRHGVVGHLESYRVAIGQATETLDVMDPWRTASPLGDALTSLREALRLLGLEEGKSSEREAGSELGRSLLERMPLVQEALLRATGLVIDVKVERDLMVPGETVSGVIELWNGGPFPLEDASAWIRVPEGWSVQGELGDSRTAPPGSLSRWGFQVHVPETAHASRAYYLGSPRVGELYDWPDDQTLWAAPADPDLLHGLISFQLGDLGEIHASRPARYRGVDKATGEFLKPAQVVPAVSVSLDPRVVVWPAQAGGTREFTVTLRGQAEGSIDGALELVVPEGWRSEPESYPFTVSDLGAGPSFVFHISRPAGGEEGQYEVSARAKARDGRVFEQGVSLVDYPHIRRGVLFPPARSRVSVFPVSVAEDLSVGYVMGSGDGGVEAIRQMGASVELLDSEALAAGNLSAFDVVVIGIRAYETRADLVASNDRLLEFAEGGGTVIVQYNQYEYPRGGFSPYEVEMSRPHDRVSDEEAPVRILVPEHPLLRSPNAIDSGDFDGWVQERGLYFLGGWSPEFTPLLEMADPGEAPKQGGLLVAPVGDGVYVYTGLSFFRQFPQGVPGAYRLFANLISLSLGEQE